MDITRPSGSIFYISYIQVHNNVWEIVLTFFMHYLMFLRNHRHLWNNWYFLWLIFLQNIKCIKFDFILALLTFDPVLCMQYFVFLMREFKYHGKIFQTLKWVEKSKLSRSWDVLQDTVLYKQCSDSEDCGLLTTASTGTRKQNVK